jgi:RimJ/RimL family protein N-acetyltransferase
MTADSPVLIDIPMPIHTPRLMIRPRKPGDGEFALAAIRETWDELHRWMWWAENLDQFTSEQLEMRNRRAIASFIQRDGIELLGIETATGEPVVWCGFHDIDWKARQCDTGFWVRRSAQGRKYCNRVDERDAPLCFWCVRHVPGRPYGMRPATGLLKN